MRCGQLLAEASPNQLLSKFQCLSLEEAFLALSQKQKENQDRGITETQTDYLAELEEISPTIPSTDLSYSTDVRKLIIVIYYNKVINCNHKDIL